MDTKKKTSNKFSPEVRERAVRMVLEYRGDHASQWAAIVGTYRAVGEKHVPRYLAEFEYRFNRRYDLNNMIPRLAVIATKTVFRPYRLLKLADFQA